MSHGQRLPASRGYLVRIAEESHDHVFVRVIDDACVEALHGPAMIDKSSTRRVLEYSPDQALGEVHLPWRLLLFKTHHRVELGPVHQRDGACLEQLSMVQS